MKRILITGGAGFIGSHLCDHLLKDGNEVICLDNFFTGSRNNVTNLASNPRFELFRHDVCESIHIDADEIYHLACPASPIHYQKNPVRTIRTIVQGTLNMLDLARDTGARILLTSTSEIYGDPQVHPQTEDYWGHVNPIGPRACYDEAKRCAEALAVSYANQYGVEIRIARVFNTFGPKLAEGDGRVVSNFIVQALQGKPLTVYGDGSQTRSFCYVSDTVDGLMRLMSSSETRPVNIGNPHEISMLDLAEKVIDLTDSRSTIVHKPLPADDPARRCPDVSRAEKILGWRPAISLDEGLRRTYDYFLSRLT